MNVGMPAIHRRPFFTPFHCLFLNVGGARAEPLTQVATDPPLLWRSRCGRDYGAPSPLCFVKRDTGGYCERTLIDAKVKRVRKYLSLVVGEVHWYEQLILEKSFFLPCRPFHGFYAS